MQFFTPSVIHGLTAEYLSIKDILTLCKTSKAAFELYQPILFDRFLKEVTRNNDDDVRLVAQEHSWMLTKKGRVVDPAGRIFESCSAFEYALWALNEPLWRIMLDSVPQEQVELFNTFAEQYQTLISSGLCYTLQEKTRQESHFDLDGEFIAALQKQVTLCKEEGVQDWNAIGVQWINEVGGAQRTLPMHLVHIYCMEQLDESIPNSTKPQNKTTFYHFTSDKEEEWFGNGSKLGKRFAIYKDKSGANSAGRSSCESLLKDNEQTLTTFQDLSKKRVNALKQLQLIPRTTKESKSNP